MKISTTSNIFENLRFRFLKTNYSCYYSDTWNRYFPLGTLTLQRSHDLVYVNWLPHANWLRFVEFASRQLFGQNMSHEKRYRSVLSLWCHFWRSRKSNYHRLGFVRPTCYLMCLGDINFETVLKELGAIFFISIFLVPNPLHFLSCLSPSVISWIIRCR